jgi:threonine/homoserine/homoserine lactone efflux protein
MPLETVIQFLIATAIVTIIPGPNIMVVIHESVQKNTKKGLAAVSGVTCGMIPLFLLSLAGVSSLLIKWPWLFNLIRFAGMGYLIYLGIVIIRSATNSADLDIETTCSSHSSFLRGFLTCISNPKGLLFAGAFFPQFLHTGRPILPQAAILCGGCLFVATIIGTGYAFFAGAISAGMRSRKLTRLSSVVSGSLLILFGISLVFADIAPL